MKMTNEEKVTKLLSRPMLISDDDYDFLARLSKLGSDYKLSDEERNRLDEIKWSKK